MLNYYQCKKERHRRSQELEGEHPKAFKEALLAVAFKEMLAAEFKKWSRQLWASLGQNVWECHHTAIGSHLEGSP